MNIYTYYTSFLFLLTSFVAPNPLMTNLLALLSCTSILHHSKFFEQYPGKTLVIITDRTLAHTITALSFIQSLKLSIKYHNNSIYLFGYYMCLVYTILIYYVYLKHTIDLNVHATMHMASALGLYLLFQAQKD